MAEDAPLNHQSVYQMVLDATGDREQAERITRAFIADQLRRGLTPE